LNIWKFFLRFHYMNLKKTIKNIGKSKIGFFNLPNDITLNMDLFKVNLRFYYFNGEVKEIHHIHKIFTVKEYVFTGGHIMRLYKFGWGEDDYWVYIHKDKINLVNDYLITKWYAKTI
jgi:hypothetical protein